MAEEVALVGIVLGDYGLIFAVVSLPIGFVPVEVAAELGWRDADPSKFRAWLVLPTGIATILALVTGNAAIAAFVAGACGFFALTMRLPAATVD